MNTPVIFAYASAAFAGILALGGAFRARRSVSRWAFVAGMAVLALERVCTGLSAGTPLLANMDYWKGGGLIAAAFLPGVWLLFSLTYARGNAREFLTRWRLALAAAFVLPPALGLLFRGSLIVEIYQLEAGPPLLRLGPAGVALYALLLIAAVLVLMNLERTYRASVGTMRWRIKFMLLGVGLIFVVRLYTNSQALLFRGVDPSLAVLDSGALLVAALLVLRSLFRAGHFDLDVYPSHAVLQSSFTVLLAGIYLLVVGVFAKIVVLLGGDTAFAVKTFLMLLSLVALAVLLQSDRVRLHLGRFVSRQFQRPIYDYRMVWRRFTEATASRVEQIDLCRALVRLTADMFQALSVTIWLMDDRRESLTLAASTSLSEARGREFGPQTAETGEVLGYFRQHPEPVDIESSKGDWAAALRRWQPSEFPDGGHRVCLPLVDRGEVLGVITLGDRVGGVPFSLQDFDLLKCIGDQAAASLLNVQLSQRLLQAKELEAFQTMAAFFVHDLKNSASTLNLMLQNLPTHFSDPAFREDALRGVSKSVVHINHLIGRLSLLRHEMKIQRAEADLNEMVVKGLAGLETGLASVIVKDLKPLPRMLFDSEQMSKVVTNLVLNATEAVSGEGQVRIATDQTNGWAVLTVADDGCGMTAEFISRSLFRPFQTTKINGLGIGMFQSKMIVEAHGGRITAVSEPGKGTTFQVLLPLASRAQAVSGKEAGG